LQHQHFFRHPSFGTVFSNHLVAPRGGRRH
jgi:hypothetical protein